MRAREGTSGRNRGQADRSQESILLLVNSRGKVQGVRLRAAGPVAEGHRPETRIGNRFATGIRELAEESARARVERVDPAVAEVADPEGVAELAEVGGGQRNPVR